MRRIADMLAAGSKAIPVGANRVHHEMARRSSETWGTDVYRLIKEGVPIITVDEVSDFVDCYGGSHEDMRQFPCCVPPWPACLVEWRSSALHKNAYLQVLENVTSISFLACVTTICRSSRSLSVLDAFGKWTETFPEIAGLDVHWIVGLSAAFRMTGNCDSRIRSNPTVAYLFFDTEGRLVSARGADVSLYRVPLQAFAFCHCKNVQIEERQPTDEERKWHRRQRSKPIIYKTLRIGGMRKILETEGGLAENGPGKALHICRGHFARYTADAPLFGRHVGQFWHPQHMRGKKENGEVVKRYEVTTAAPAP